MVFIYENALTSFQTSVHAFVGCVLQQWLDNRIKEEK